VNNKAFSTLLLLVCLAVMSSVALGQQQQRRARRSGGLDNMSLPSTGVVASSAGWQEVAPEGTGFSVMMPGTPDEMSNQLGTGPLSLRIFHVRAGDVEYATGVVLNFPVELSEQPGHHPVKGIQGQGLQAGRSTLCLNP
jgi:hypothetical protein